MALNSGGENVPEIIPLNEYNFKRAKLKVCIAWLAFKAHQNLDADVPEDLLNPLFRDGNGHDNLKPSVIYQLASGELYCLACSNIFPPSIHPWRSHGSVIHALSRKGIYVLDDGGEPVSEVNLSQTQRIKLSSHQAMMEAIMKAYTAEYVSVDAVVKAVRKIVSFNASSELPFDQEDALLFWINKVCLAVKHNLERGRKSQQEQLVQSAPQMVRMRRDQLQVKELPYIPVIEDLIKDFSDGCCLAVLISYYCPRLLQFDDIVLRETMSFADSLHNLQLIQSFFMKYHQETFHYQLEDLLYTHHSLKTSIITFCAELFSIFETVKPENVFSIQQTGSSRTPVSSEISQMKNSLPISEVTRRSYRGSSQFVDDPKSSTGPSSQQKLLPGRNQQRRSMVIEGNPLTHQDLRRSTSLEELSPDKPLPAWQSPDIIRSSAVPVVRKKNAESLLSNVSIESDVGHSQDTYLVNSRPQWSQAAPAAGDDEVAALTASGDASPSRRFNPVNLPPAGITTQSADLRKTMRLDLSLAEKQSRSVGNSPRDRLLPSPGRAFKEPRSVSKTAERGESSKDGMISWEQRVSMDTPDSVGSSSTPQSGETVIDAFEKQSARKKWTSQAFHQAEKRAQDGSPHVTQAKSGAAFFVSHESEMPPETGKSFIMSDGPCNEESAQLAGIPVVSTSLEQHVEGASFVLSDGPDVENRSHLVTALGPSSVLFNKASNEDGPVHRAQQYPKFASSKELGHRSGVPAVAESIGGRESFVLSDQRSHMPVVTTSLRDLEDSQLSPHQTNTINVSSSHGPPSMPDPPHICVASDSPLHANSSHSPQRFYLSDNNLLPQPIMETTNEGRLDGSMLCIPLSSDDDARENNESTKLHAELKESESKNVPPLSSSAYVNGCEEEHEASGDMLLSEIVTCENRNDDEGVDVHVQSTDDMITWLANANPSSNTINSDPEVQEELPLSELAQIRMQLEKKRRHIDHEKRKLDRHWHKQKMKVNKEAFLQCVSQKRPPEDTHIPPSVAASQSPRVRDIHPTPTKITFADISAQKQEKQFKMKDDLRAFSDSSQSGRSVTDSGSNRSASPTSSTGSHSPLLTHDEYHASIEKLNANLTELQSQITRLSQQQEQQKLEQEQPMTERLELQELNGQLSPRPVGPVVQNREEVMNSRPNFIEQPESALSTVDNVDIDMGNDGLAKTFTVGQQESDKKQMYMEIDMNLEKKAVKPKPKLGTRIAVEQPPAPVVPIKNTAAPVQKAKSVKEEDLSTEQQGDLNGTASSTASEDKPVGFVVEMAVQEDDEMAKRREVFLKAQLKRQEQERKKKASREHDIEKQRDDRRRKQEEQEQKKAEEKARREQIMQEYQNRKKREQDGDVERPSKTKAKSRTNKSKVMTDSTNVKQPVVKKADPGKTDAVDSALSHTIESVGSDSDEFILCVIPHSGLLKGHTIMSEGSDSIDASPSSSAFSKFKADKTFKALPDRQGPRITPKSTPSPDSPSKIPTNGSIPRIKRSGSFKGNRPPSPGRSSPGRRSPSPRPPSPMMQRRRSNTLPESLKSDDSESANAGSIPSDSIVREHSEISHPGSNESGSPAAAEYTGPKLYVKPTSRSNKNIICNAISHCVLAGVPNTPQRDKVLEEVTKSEHKHFMILFRDQGLQYRAVYGFDPDTDGMIKVYGTGPRHITNKMLECIYKYDSGSKKFSKIHSKTLSVQVDGLTIGQVYWQSKRASSKK